jgi:hypothetical protein
MSESKFAGTDAGLDPIGCLSTLDNEPDNISAGSCRAYRVRVKFRDADAVYLVD